MTEDRIFKNKVKEVAELNGLSYTDAKKAVIELNKKIEEASKNPNSSISKYMNSKSLEDTVNNDYIFPLDESLALFVEPMKEHYFRVKRGKPLNSEKGETDFFELSTKSPVRWLDFLPLNNKVRKVIYSNVVRDASFRTDEESVRKIYFSLVEHFTPERSYFIDGYGNNFAINLKKVIQKLKNHKDDENIMVGLVSGRIDMTEGVYIRLIKELNELVESKNICIVSDLLSDYVQVQVELDLDEVEIKYYPFDKWHGGSYYRSTNKTILGHVSGVTRFINSPVSLIEKSDTSCIEKIYQLNKDNFDFIHWKTKDDVKEEGLSKNSFIKIDFEMDNDDFETLLLITRDLWHYFDSGKKNPRDIEIIIETPDAEKIQSYYQDKTIECDRFITRYVIIDDNLYDINGTQISLYKN